MNNEITWGELRATINTKAKDSDIVDWVDVSYPMTGLTVVRYNGNHIKVYDTVFTQDLSVATKKSPPKKKQRQVTALTPAVKKKKTKKKPR